MGDLPLTKNQVKKVSAILSEEAVSSEDTEWALGIADAWRESHREVLSFVQDELKNFAQAVDPTSVVVGRVKRMDTILGKLRRPGMRMKLNEMYDIVGCRVITKDISSVRQIAELAKQHFDVKLGTGIKDYIENPKQNGYRCLHIIVRRDAPEAGLHGLFCEIQIRTRLQHAWATALETYDVISRGGLKFDEGTDDEKRYFALISNVFALEEEAPLIQGLPADIASLKREIALLDERLHISKKLRACSGSVTVVAQEGAFSGDAYCLLAIDYAEQKTDLFVYDSSEEAGANEMYARREKMKEDLQDVLLVRVSSLKSLSEAYPSYSTDIGFFLAAMDELLG